MKKLLFLLLILTGSLSAEKVNTRDANYPFSIQTAWNQNIYAHRAFYYIEEMGNVTIATVIKDNSGLAKVGDQYVVYSTYPFDIISISHKKSHKKVNGIEYTVYDHGYFKVYSTDKSQFYIVK